MTKYILLYLDQSYWYRLGQEENRELHDWLAELVDRTCVIVPFSAVLFGETAKAAPKLRKQLVPLFVRFTGYIAIINFLEALRLEHRRYVEGHDVEWLRDRLFTYDWQTMFAPKDLLPPAPGKTLPKRK